MTQPMNDGHLRAYLDHELDSATRQHLTAALEHDPRLRARLATLDATRQRVVAHLHASPPPSSTAAALQRVQAQHTEASTQRRPWRNHMNNAWRNALTPRRMALAGVPLAILLLSLVFFPPVRALADQLLQVFRVQEVVFVPINDDRMSELENLDFDKSTLFVGEPVTTEDGGEPYAVADAAAASDAVGYPVNEPEYLPTPATATEVMVQNGGAGTAQVNVEAAQQILDLLGITDVSIPPELGDEPIAVSTDAITNIEYTTADGTIALTQGYSPNVTLPDNVNLQQLGKALLRVLGMEPQQAEILSQQIDWSSTLVVPLPTDINTLQQVTVNGAPGLLAQNIEHRGRDNAEAHEGTVWQLYWQDSDRFYVLNGDSPLSDDEIIAIASSVR